MNFCQVIINGVRIFKQSIQSRQKMCFSKHSALRTCLHKLFAHLYDLPSYSNLGHVFSHVRHIFYSSETLRSLNWINSHIQPSVSSSTKLMGTHSKQFARYRLSTHQSGGIITRYVTSVLCL